MTMPSTDGGDPARAAPVAPLHIDPPRDPHGPPLAPLLLHAAAAAGPLVYCRTTTRCGGRRRWRSQHRSMGGEEGGTDRHAQPLARRGHPASRPSRRASPAAQRALKQHPRADSPSSTASAGTRRPRSRHRSARASSTSSPRTRRSQTSPISPRQEKRHRTPSTSTSSRSSSQGLHARTARRQASRRVLRQSGVGPRAQLHGE